MHLLHTFFILTVGTVLYVVWWFIVCVYEPMKLFSKYIQSLKGTGSVYPSSIVHVFLWGLSVNCWPDRLTWLMVTVCAHQNTWALRGLSELPLAFTHDWQLIFDLIWFITNPPHFSALPANQKITKNTKHETLPQAHLLNIFYVVFITLTVL